MSQEKTTTYQFAIFNADYFVLFIEFFYYIVSAYISV